MSQQVMVSGSTAVESAAASKVSASSSATFSSSSSSSFSSSSTSSKVVKQSVTSSSTTSSKSITSSSKTSSVSVKSSGQSYSDHLAGALGIDASKEMERLKLCLSDELSSFNRDLFRLMPSALPPAALEGGTAAPALALGGALDESLVRLDADSVRSCVDKANSDRLKLNFDMTEYESESISVKTVGNKIEVHAQKKSKRGDEERSEEFSRVYELPTSQDVDPTHVTSSIYQDGVLTIELPVAEALGQ